MQSGADVAFDVTDELHARVQDTNARWSSCRLKPKSHCFELIKTSRLLSCLVDIRIRQARLYTTRATSCAESFTEHLSENAAGVFAVHAKSGRRNLVFDRWASAASFRKNDDSDHTEKHASGWLWIRRCESELKAARPTSQIVMRGCFISRTFEPKLIQGQCRIKIFGGGGSRLEHFWGPAFLFTIVPVRDASYTIQIVVEIGAGNWMGTENRRP